MDIEMLPPWRKIPGYRNYAHPDGLVMGVSGALLKPKWNKSTGYWWVKARPISGGVATATLHTMICLAFHGPKILGQEVRHLNGDRDDNSAGNLVWGTHKQNGEDAIRHGHTRKGHKHSPESMEKMKRSHPGRCKDGCICKRHTNSGKYGPHKPESIEKMRMAALRRWGHDV